MCDDEDYYDEDDDSESLILSIGEDGNACIHNPDEFVEVSAKDMELIKGFIEKNKEAFKEFCETKQTEQRSEEPCNVVNDLINKQVK